MSSPPNKTKLYVGALIEIAMLGKKCVLRPATLLGNHGLKNSNNRVHARLGGPYGTDLTVMENKVLR